jgi:hypothetical protein
VRKLQQASELLELWRVCGVLEIKSLKCGIGMMKEILGRKSDRGFGTKQATRSETNSGPDVAKSKPALKTRDRQATQATGSFRNFVDLAYASSSTHTIGDSGATGATRTYTYRQSD